MAEDLTGRRFGRLVVVSRAPNGKNWRARWNCICDCGNNSVVCASHLKNGHTQSCGCLNKEINSNRNKQNRKYKYCNNRIYDCWKDMKRRCYDPNNSHAKNYYQKGIRVCDEWYNSFENFQEWAITHGYQDNLTLDRIDGNKDYCPENCRWATLKQQGNNTSRNRLIEYKGKVQTLAQWCDELGLKYKVIENRINRYKWTVERAFETPVYKRPWNKKEGV